MLILSDNDKRQIASSILSFIVSRGRDLVLNLSIFFKSDDIIISHDDTHITLYEYGIIIYNNNNIDKRYEVYDFDSQKQLEIRVLTFIDDYWFKTDTNLKSTK
jgi:hypothetical protein